MEPKTIAKITEDTEVCPVCGARWKGEDIFEHFKKLREEGSSYYVHKSDKQLEKTARCYGWSKTKPTSFSRLISIENPHLYDGVSWWECPDCGSRWDRWTGKLTEKIEIR